jgi:hypothetical protein
MMLGVTTYLSTDIAAVPLMWIVPLAIYLITFVFAFSAVGRRTGAMAGRLAPILLVTLAGCIVTQTRAPLTLVIPLHLAAFALLALQCHTALANDRPLAGRLTEFYFLTSLGGMLGGLFNTLLAPVIFRSVIEYPLALVLACALGAFAARVSVRRAVVDTLVSFAGVAGLTAAATIVLQRSGAGRALFLAALGVPSILVFTHRRNALRFAASVAGLLVGGALLADAGQPLLHAERTFFGVLRVVQDAHGQFHGLTHGTTLHGLQSLDPARRHEPLTYYHRTGPFGQAFTALPAAASAARWRSSLGAGSLAAYARQPSIGRSTRSIPPSSEREDRRYFTYLNDCGMPAACSVTPGCLCSARVTVVRSHRAGCFSSDAIRCISSPARRCRCMSRAWRRRALCSSTSRTSTAACPGTGWRRATGAARRAGRSDAGGPTAQRQDPVALVVMARTPDDLGPLVHDRAGRRRTRPRTRRCGPTTSPTSSASCGFARRTACKQQQPCR